VRDVGERHRQSIEADGDARAVRETRGERTEQALVERWRLASACTPAGEFLLETRALLVRVGELVIPASVPR